VRDGRRQRVQADRNRHHRPEASGDRLMVERARKLQNCFAQPFFVAEPSHRPGVHVGMEEALRTCRDILEGRHGDLLAAAFYFAGSIDEIRNRAAAM
jgi:F-type H+-transporting ATPase subunit beta